MIRWIYLQEHHQVVQNIREYYFKDEVIDTNDLELYFAMFTDINFTYQIYQAAKDHAMKSNGKAFYSR